MNTHSGVADQHAPDVSPESAHAGHEKTDVSVKAILWLAAGVALGALVVHLGLWVLLGAFNVRANSTDPQPPLLAKEQPSPPEPRLQSSPMLDFEEYRLKEEHKLNSYGWADAEKKSVRIPVSRAMDLIAERGLPEVPAAEPPPAVPPEAADNVEVPPVEPAREPTNAAP